MKTNWQYVTFDYSLQLDLEPIFGEVTPVKVEAEYDPLDLVANEISVYIPCRHDPNCKGTDHILDIQSLVTDAMWKEIDSSAIARIREHHAARMEEE